MIVSLLDVPEERRLPLSEEAFGQAAPVDPELFELELQHSQLPKLAEAASIRWERDSLTLQRGSQFKEPARIMRLLHDLPAQYSHRLTYGE